LYLLTSWHWLELADLFRCVQNKAEKSCPNLDRQDLLDPVRCGSPDSFKLASKHSSDALHVAVPTEASLAVLQEQNMLIITFPQSP